MILLWYWVCLCFFIYLFSFESYSICIFSGFRFAQKWATLSGGKAEWLQNDLSREGKLLSLHSTHILYSSLNIACQRAKLDTLLAFFWTVCVGGEQASFCLKCASLDICSCIKAISRRYSVQQHLLVAHCLDIKLARYKIKILVIPPTSAPFVIDWEKPHSWQQVKRDERILLWSNDASRSPVWKEDGTVMIETSVTDPVHAAAACREVLCTCERIEDGNGSQRHHYILLIIIQ